jgi:glycine/D-amino acid oxidase-like deaminating enzyme
MANVAVVGAGAVGTAVGLELLKQGHSVTVVTKEVAGGLEDRGGITTHWAAGIGCIFKPSSPFVGKLVLDSYEEWMALARNQGDRHVMTTDLKIVTKPNENISYASQVEGFQRLDETTAQYTTYSLNPKMTLETRIAEMRARGAQFELRAVTPDEVVSLQQGIPLAGSDYTVEAIGLAARDLHPELNLFPIAGVLVHYIDPATQELCDSYMHEEKAIYVVTRPSPHGREIILGGTFLEGIGQMAHEDRLRYAEQIESQIRGEFEDRGFDPARLKNGRRDATVGFRPARVGNPVIEQRGKVSIVTGFGGQGLVTNPAVARMVAEQVGSVFDHFSGVAMPPVDAE